MSNKNENIFSPDVALSLRLANRMFHDLQDIQRECERCMREHFHLSEKEIEMLREGKTIHQIREGKEK